MQVSDKEWEYCSSAHIFGYTNVTNKYKKIRKTQFVLFWKVFFIWQAGFFYTPAQILRQIGKLDIRWRNSNVIFAEIHDSSEIE